MLISGFYVGYQKLKEFIVTQHPLEATVSDFWQMVWDHNSQTVVVLSDSADDEYQIFWPLKQADVEFENFRVRFIDEHKIQLPAVGNHPAHPEEYVTQIEVAAQSLQVRGIKNNFFLVLEISKFHLFYYLPRMIMSCGCVYFTAPAGRIEEPQIPIWPPCFGCPSW